MGEHSGVVSRRPDVQHGPRRCPTINYIDRDAEPPDDGYDIGWTSPRPVDGAARRTTSRKAGLVARLLSRARRKPS